MIYQSKIVVRGREVPIIVSKAVADQISGVWADKKVEKDQLIILKHMRFLKGDIRAIDVLPDKVAEGFDDEVRKFYDEERRERAKAVALTPKAKSMRLEMFRELYRVVTGTYPTPEVLGEARQKQEQFFTANPKRTVCDANRLIPLIPAARGQRISKFHSAFIGMVGRAIGRDVQLSRQINN